MTSEKEKDYIMETTELFNLDKINYNCAECSSPIEIISINENKYTIEFKCIKNIHRGNMLIRDYLEKMKIFNNNNKINCDECNIEEHNKKKFQCYCLNCNMHLCEECLKSRNHIRHHKINIIEIQPNQKELNIVERKIKDYEYKIDILENEKLKRIKEIMNIFTNYKNILKGKNEKKLKENKTNMNKEYKLYNNKYKIEIENIRNKYEKEIKSKKYEYENIKKEVKSKYNNMNDYINIVYMNKIENLNYQFIRIIQKFELNKKLENLKNIKRLNEIIYYTYDKNKNNYYNSTNINSLLINYSNNKNININSNNENIIKLKNEKDKINRLKDKNKDEKNKYKPLKIKNEEKINNNIIINKIKEYDDGIYEGEIKNNKKDGKGIYYYKHGDRYEGEFKNDNIDGKGIYYWLDGDKYEGEFKNNKREGKGIYFYKNGNRYEGEIKNNKRNGKGKFYYNNGDRYKNYKNGKKDGKGIFYYKNGDRYEGEFKNGEIKGIGIYYYSNGDVEIKTYLEGIKI